MWLVQADIQYVRHVDHAQDKYNSIVFNAFIFLQLFNMINARKIKDELNPFRGELIALPHRAFALVVMLRAPPMSTLLLLLVCCEQDQMLQL